MWNRAQVQPLELVTDTIDGVSRGVEASAEAESVEDLFARLEACGQLLRLDPTVAPTMYHAATSTVAEVSLLRTIENVVRLGHVKSIGAHEIVLEQGTTPTDRGQLYIDCSAAGLGKAPARPIFQPGRITLQCISTGFPTFNAAVIGYLEASRGDDQVAESRLSPTNRYPDAAKDWIPNMRGQLESIRLWDEQADIAAWLGSSRLNIARGMFKKASERPMAEAITRLLTYTERCRCQPRKAQRPSDWATRLGDVRETRASDQLAENRLSSDVLVARAASGFRHNQDRPPYPAGQAAPP